MKSQNKSGFTLVEIMIVVVIIGLLAAMAIPAFQKIREASIVQAEKNRMKEMGVITPKVLVISHKNQVIEKSPILGVMTLLDGKVKWTDDKGVSREHILGQDQTFEIR